MAPESASVDVAADEQQHKDSKTVASQKTADSDTVMAFSREARPRPPSRTTQDLGIDRDLRPCDGSRASTPRVRGEVLLGLVAARARAQQRPSSMTIDRA